MSAPFPKANFEKFEQAKAHAEEQQRGAQHDAAPPFSRIINPADLDGKPVPPREWLVTNLIPAKQVTLLFGDGGVGKSLLALQLCAAMAIGRDWLGFSPESGRSLMISAEDDGDEMHRRLVDIVNHYGAPLSALGDMRIVDAVGEDSILAAPAGKRIELTIVYQRLDTIMSEFKPNLLVLDVLSKMFAGNEIDRVHATAFLDLLTRLARKHACTVLLLAHPSLTGLNTGTGTSGSTGFSNGVRSRLYFYVPKAADGEIANPDLRILELKKTNYAKVGEQVVVERHKGAWRTLAAPSSLDRMAAESKADRVFMTILRRFNEQGRSACDMNGTSYAPALFAKEPDAEHVTKEQFAGAMRRLFFKKKIEKVNRGKPSRPSWTFIPTEDKETEE